MDPRDTRVWQAPDLSAELTFPDYRTGRDPAMKKRSRRRDRKCSPKSRTSFLGHPSAMKFLRISQKREFSTATAWFRQLSKTAGIALH
jgi:hypothetical protein